MKSKVSSPDFRATDVPVEHEHDSEISLRATARTEISRLIADVEDLLRKLTHVTDEDVRRLRQDVEHAVQATKRSLQEGAVQAGARAKQVATATDAYVRQQPWTALGIVAALGVLLGVLSSRR